MRMCRLLGTIGMKFEPFPGTFVSFKHGTTAFMDASPSATGTMVGVYTPFHYKGRIEFTLPENAYGATVRIARNAENAYGDPVLLRGLISGSNLDGTVLGLAEGAEISGDQTFSFPRGTGYPETAFAFAGSYPAGTYYFYFWSNSAEASNYGMFINKIPDTEFDITITGNTAYA